MRALSFTVTRFAPRGEANGSIDLFCCIRYDVSNKRFDLANRQYSRPDQLKSNLTFHNLSEMIDHSNIVYCLVKRNNNIQQRQENNSCFTALYHKHGAYVKTFTLYTL